MELTRTEPVTHLKWIQATWFESSEWWGILPFRGLMSQSKGSYWLWSLSNTVLSSSLVCSGFKSQRESDELQQLSQENFEIIESSSLFVACEDRPTFFMWYTLIRMIFTRQTKNKLKVETDLMVQPLSCPHNNNMLHTEVSQFYCDRFVMYISLKKSDGWW